MSNPYQQKATRETVAATTAAVCNRRKNKSDNPHLLQGILEKLRPFQREAFDFATKGKTFHRQWNNDTSTSSSNDDDFQYDPSLLGRGKILLGDEMGLGKTVTSLAIMTAYRDEWPLLILCPASLRHMWPCEIETFLPSIPPSAVYVLNGFDDAGFLTNPKIQIVVASYSLLQTRSAAARVLQETKFECVICDESHNLKERNSQRCKLAWPILQNANRLILLSGTPALARPVELWSQVSCLAPNLFGSYGAYTKKYCNARRGRFGWDVSGLSNANELHQNLRQVMVRRLKNNVLKELPPKQRSIVPIKISGDQKKACMKLMDDLKETRVSVEQLVGGDARDAHFEARRLLMQGYQLSGVAKARAVADVLLDWLAGSSTQKILVFGHHLQVLDTLEQACAKKFKGVGHIRIDGSVPSKERAVRVKKFQTNSRVRVAILSMTAAGTGLTLTAASSVLFAELHWTPGVLAQAEDRCHRIGQVNAVNVMYCVCKEQELSVDMSLWSMLGKKVGTLGKVIDGCKGASMEAKEQDGPNCGGASGESAEDELVRFFAETSTEETQTPSRVPVKGSIMSFFKPASSTTPSASGAGQSETKETQLQRMGCSKSIATSQPAVAKPLEKASVSTVQQQKAVDVVSWSCETCTFENSRRKGKGGWLACEMCGTPKIEEDGGGEEQKPSPSGDYTPTNVKEPIVIDLDSEEKKPARSPETIVIDVDDPDPFDSDSNVVDVDTPSLSVVTPFSVKRARKEDPKLRMKAAPEPNCVLHFSVSVNSGRILFHSARSGDSLCHGFSIDQVLTDESNDSLLQASVKRTNERSMTQVDLQFCSTSVLKVIRGLSIVSNDAETERKCCQELRSFVSAYTSLREVEKKALKQWGEPVSAFGLQKTVARMLASSVGKMCKERYEGGAKERAQKNLQQGLTLSPEDKAVLAGTACAWCGGTLPHMFLAPGVEATYCSQTCAAEGRLGRGGMYASTRVRAQVFELEGGVCQKCNIDAHAIYLRIRALQPAERLSALCNANWRLPKKSSALERLLQNPKEGDFWQADHIVAVAEGGGACGLDNLRTLCTPCHKVETDRLRARLRLSSALGEQESSSGDTRKQMDIRSAFFAPSSASKSAISKPSGNKKRSRN